MAGKGYWTFRYCESPSRSASVLRCILALHSSRCFWRGLQRVLGSVQWLASPHSCVGAWLAPVYQHLFSGFLLQRRLPTRTLSFLLTAFFLTLPPVRPRVLPPPFTMTPIFSDAAPGASSFVVACSRPFSFATTTTTPTWLRSIQDAELYGIFHTLRQCSFQKLSHVCILTDNLGVYHTLRSGRVPAACHPRARILRRIIRVCFHSRLSFQIAWVPSSKNAADFFSRPHQYTPSHALWFSSVLHQLVPSSTLPVSTIPSLWFRTPFSPCVTG